MHEAYILKHVLKGLLVAVDCISCCNNGDTLLVATQQGNLLVYNIRALDRDNYAVDLQKVNKQYAKGRVQQIEAIPDYSLVLSLVDGVISVHDLATQQFISALKVRGVSYFCTDYQRPSGFALAPPTGESREAQSPVRPTKARPLRLCVCVKRKLELLCWNDSAREFQPVASANELSIVEPPRCIAWIGDALCIGIKKEYFIVKTDSGNVINLFPIGLKQSGPIITKVYSNPLALASVHSAPSQAVARGPLANLSNANPDGSASQAARCAVEEFALVSDEVSMFVNVDGNRTRKGGLKWGDVPIAQEFSDPYLVALLARVVEIRNFETRQLVQTIDVNEPKLLIEFRGSIYIAGSRECKDVYRLAPVSFETQINQLKEQKEFELALRLAFALEHEKDAGTRKEASSASPRKTPPTRNDDASSQIYQIKHSYAFELFVQQRYDDAFRIYRDIRVDPRYVIGLFPDLGDKQASFKYPGEIPKLQFTELEAALDKLQEYLIGERRSLFREVTSAQQQPDPSNEKFIESKRYLAEIIDTTLLKCYLQTNYLLIASLLRLPDCSCRLEESEKLLKAKEKFNELLILYERRGLHGKALELLKVHASNPESSLRGVEHTISYLQRLSNVHLPLIFDYSKWVLKESPNEALQIFIEDSDEARGLQRADVFRFLNEHASQLSLLYLEHIINNWNDDTMQFHDALARMYLSRYVGSLNKSTTECNTWRQKLNLFLRSSSYYTAESMLSSLPDDGLFEERAVVLGRLAMHDEALTVHVHVLNNIEQAEQYCETHYDANAVKNRDVFLTLFRITLTQPDLKALGLKLTRNVTYEQDAESRAAQSYKLAWRVLGKYAARIDAFKAFERVPDGARLSEIFEFVRQIFDCQLQRVAEISPRRRLGAFENLLARVETSVLKETHFTVNDDSVCATCQKRIGMCVFVRQANGDLMHFGCSSLQREDDATL